MPLLAYECDAVSWICDVVSPIFVAGLGEMHQWKGVVQLV
jgi:hypothetical protein